jgi:HAD superfamily hydrolase (TIGR01509 family)
VTVRAVIFDFNGVIVDDEPLHHRAFRQVVGDLDEATYFEKYLGLDDWGFFRAYYGIEDVDDLVERKAAAYLEHIDEARLIDGAAELIRSLSVPMAIASGARTHEIEAILDRAGLRDRFDAIVSADDVDDGKPSPSCFLTALARLAEKHEVLARQTVVIEDAPHGIDAAKAAGMACIAVARSRARADLARADLIVGRLSELNVADVMRVIT